MSEEQRREAGCPAREFGRESLTWDTDDHAAAPKNSVRFSFRNAADRAISWRPSMPSSIEIQPLNPTPGQDAENRVVVVHPLPGLAVHERRGIAGGAVAACEVVERRAGREDTDPTRAS